MGETTPTFTTTSCCAHWAQLILSQPLNSFRPRKRRRHGPRGEGGSGVRERVLTPARVRKGKASHHGGAVPPFPRL